MAEANLSVDAATRVLEVLGVTPSPEALAIERRDDRWLITWGSDRIVWVAATPRGRVLIARERRLLGLLHGRMPFDVPAVIAEAPDGTADLRTRIAGVVDPWRVHHRVLEDASFAWRLGVALGRALAALHARDLSEAVMTWLPPEPEWPAPSPITLDALRRVVDDPVIHRRAEVVLESYARLRGSLQPHERVLVHGDLGFHNVVLSPDDDSLRGIFDWEGAAWTDRHLDFRYLLADLEDPTLFESARSSYEASGGQPIERSRVVLHNAVWALSYLAYREGIPPETRWCGRTLAEDLAWTRRALALIHREA